MTDCSTHGSFQGKYFGSRVVDGRCVRELLSWIIEEFLLNEFDYKSIWFSPAVSKISFVQDDGTELMNHDYSVITHFTVLKDDRSFGYLVRYSANTSFNFYAYQAFEKADVSLNCYYNNVI